jgi:hypothetical protein
MEKMKSRWDAAKRKGKIDKLLDYTRRSLVLLERVEMNY